MQKGLTPAMRMPNVQMWLEDSPVTVSLGSLEMDLSVKVCQMTKQIELIPFLLIIFNPSLLPGS